MYIHLYYPQLHHVTHHTPFAIVSLKLSGVSTVSSTEDSGLAGAAVANVKEQRRSANGSRETMLSSNMRLWQKTAYGVVGGGSGCWSSEMPINRRRHATAKPPPPSLTNTQHLRLAMALSSSWHFKVFTL